ncbi:hypothetical protein [Amycolatopsis sp. GA6-003]
MTGAYACAAVEWREKDAYACAAVGWTGRLAKHGYACCDRLHRTLAKGA